ncbi:MAG: hypothetical protein M3O70_09250 [Actinomycetota bacterium]|nr:hypothetical protein [Actinomycetota bacterium]
MSSELYGYTVTAHVRRDKNQHLRVDQLHGDHGGGDLVDVFDTVVQPGVQWPPPPEEDVEDTRDTIARVERVNTPDTDPRVRWGRVRVTRGAVRHDVEQAETGQTIAIRDADREGRPLFFWLVAPTNATSALLLTERRARFGIVSGFWMNVLIGRLRDQFPGATFDLSYYAPQPVWEEYRQHGDGIEGLVLRRVMAEEREDRELDEPTRRRVAGTMTTTIDRAIVPSRQRVAEALRGNNRVDAVELVIGDLPETVGDVDEYDTVKLRVVMGGKRRTVILGRNRAPQLGYPVTQVRQDDEDYPRPDDMAAFATKLAREIGRPLGIR